MNEHDSEQILDLLESINYVSTSDPQNADLILINTCSVREKSEQKFYSLLGRLKKYRRKGQVLLGVGGCVAQQERIALFEKAPFIDVVFGTGAIHRLPELIETARETGTTQIDTDFVDKHHPFLRPEGSAASKIKAYVTIMQGCDNFCSFCVVPFVRGREKSRPSRDVIHEVNDLAHFGVREVTLLGQNVNSYGLNSPGEMRFSDLIRTVSQIKGIERIRFTTSHPKDLSTDLIDCFGNVSKLCPHMHLPLQSGSTRVLERMNRGYTREEYVAKVKRLRQACPEIALTTDFIVGFPGETEKDFEETLDIVEEIEYDEFFSFKYSDRPMTQASRYDEKLPEHEKTRRLIVLQERQRAITLKKNERLVGRMVEVLVEGRSKKNPQRLSGRTLTNKVVNFEGPAGLHGDFMQVEILAAYPHSLYGRAV